jgi:hypothetical protein
VSSVKIDAKEQAHMAWKLYSADIAEEGIALVKDEDGRKLAMRSFDLAKIFLEEKARRKPRKVRKSKDDGDKKRSDEGDKPKGDGKPDDDSKPKPKPKPKPKSDEASAEPKADEAPDADTDGGDKAAPPAE